MLKALSEENQRMDRLDKLVAAFSDYSRKDVRKLVMEKRVEVNGICAQSFDQKISDDDSVTLDGEPILRKRTFWQRFSLKTKQNGEKCV